MMDEIVMKYLNGLHLLEINPNTNWKEYGSIGEYLNYEWKKNEKWHDEDMKQRKGKWVSYETANIFLAILPLISPEEATSSFLNFANKVMEVKE